MITLKFKNFVIIVAKMTDRKRTTRRDDEREEYIPADFWLWPVATNASRLSARGTISLNDSETMRVDRGRARMQMLKSGRN